MGLFGALALIVIAYWFFRSPLCAACTDWVRRSQRAGVDARLDEAVERLADEVAAVRDEVEELAERLDLAERVLAEARRREGLLSERGR